MLAGTIHLQVMSDVLEPRIIQQVEAQLHVAASTAAFHSKPTAKEDEWLLVATAPVVV